MIRPMAGVQISNQLALHLMRVHPEVGYVQILHFVKMGASIQSESSQLINLHGGINGQHPERHKRILACRVCTDLYFVYVSLSLHDHLKINC